MLIKIPFVNMTDGTKQYLIDCEDYLKYNSTVYSSIDTCSRCIYPMTSTDIFLKSNWDKNVIDWLKWINRNICLPMGHDTYKTTMVKLRIATGMLNNIESLTDLEKIQIHSNLTYNVNKELCFIRYDGLPF